MGMTYKGNSKRFRSIGQNILPTSQKFTYKNGFFGENSIHGNNRTRNITATSSIIAATVFYDTIAYGGIEQIVSDNMAITRMADGTVITMRKESSSDRSPVVDINISSSTHTGGIKSQKIHFIQED